MVGCFVIYCDSGLASSHKRQEQVHYFHPPKDQLEKWKKAIPKRNRELTKEAVVCSKHFRSEEILWHYTSGQGESQIKVRWTRPKLVPTAVPSIFPQECPQSCVPPPVKERKLPKLRSETNISTRSRKRKKHLPAMATPSSKMDENESALNCPPVAIGEEVSSFTSWEELSNILLPEEGSWSLVTIRDTKSLVQHEFSSHIQPRITIVKELRTLKDKNEVRSFVLGLEFGVSQVVSSFEELKILTDRFFKLSICYGVTPPGTYVVKNMRYGFQNILDRWQSVNCVKQIEAGSAMCRNCCALSTALDMKIFRILESTKVRSASKCRSSNHRRYLVTTLSPKKKELLRRSVGIISKAKRRLQYSKNQLKEKLNLFHEKIDKISAECIDSHIQRLNIDAGQQMVLKEILNIAKCSSKNSRRYSSDWLLTCMLMRIRSPLMYSFIHTNNILPLPHARTILRYLSRIKIGCGFDSSFFDGLKKKMTLKTEFQKFAVLIFDEVSVRRSLKTDLRTFQYQGVVDFGEDDISSTENAELADHALVFGFSSLGEDYFQPIGCFAVKGAAKGVILAKLVVQAILLLEEAGVRVIGLICDGAKTNRKMWKELGVSGERNSVKHFIQNPFEESRKIFIFSDTPHLFKCIRNRLINHDLMTRFGIVRWEHYAVLFREDKKMPGNVRICPRLTEAHIYPCSFAKMRVSLMTQIFSQSVFVGLNMYRQRLIEGLEDSEPTAKFSLYMNNLFDCLNRRHPKEGIRAGSSDITTIKEGISFLDRWEDEVNEGIIRAEEFLTKETAEGLRVTLHSTIDLINFLHDAGFNYVLTAKVNQDKIEKFFGNIRQAGCQNDHPAMPTFLQLYRLLSTYKLMRPPKFGNCSNEDSEPRKSLSLEEFKDIFRKRDPSEGALAKLKAQLDSLAEPDDWDSEISVAEEYCVGDDELIDVAIYYASGYLCRRLMKRSKCDVCINSFRTKLNTSDLVIAELVNAKSRGFLLHCNLYLYKLFRSTEIFFAKNVSSSDCYERTLCDVFENVNLTFPCDTHKSEILAVCLHYFILMRMRQYEREQNRSSKKISRKKKKEAKLANS